LFNKYCTCLEISASESGGKKEKVSNILYDAKARENKRLVHVFLSSSSSSSSSFTVAHPSYASHDMLSPARAVASRARRRVPEPPF